MYVAGTERRRSLASLWVYEPSSDALTMVSDSKTLAAASGLGDSIDLADAQMVSTGQNVWLCLVQPDAAAFFRLPAQGFAAAAKAPHRAFSKLQLNGQPFRMRPSDRLFARDGGLALLQDGIIYTISDVGEMTELDRPVNRPPMGLPPVTIGGADPVQVEFFADDTAAGPLEGLAPSTDSTPVRYPAFVLTSSRGVTVIDRDAITVRPGFPTFALRFTAWCPGPGGNDLIAYDAISGEIMRVQFAGLPR